MQKTTIGRAAKKANVNIETIRFYERKRLIEQPPQPMQGYRIYPAATVERIRFIRQAQDLGFSLAEISGLLSLRADPNSDCSHVRLHAQQKLDEVERKIQVLNTMRQSLRTLVKACPGSGALETCTIMDTLMTSANKEQ